MKYLGIDYGTKKIGLSYSDEEGKFAFPFGVFLNKDFWSNLQKIILEKEIKGVVIGESRASNNQMNEIAEDANHFGKKIINEFKIPVFFEREDFSSVEAHRYQTKKGDKDDSAAAIILQRFLDKQQKN